ncbi:MAG: polysaccharide deacetylase family protein, partial [Pseudoxanthomonas sp.]
MRLLVLLFSICAWLPASAAQAGDSIDRRIAVTIDDLPWARLEGIVPADLQARHQRLIEQLRRADVPVVGFVNENKLEVDGKVDPQRLAMLQDWLDARYELGNHTYSHADINEVGTSAFEKEILDGERQLRPLLAERGQVPRWFRHPYLRAGRTAEQKAAVATFLDAHGYRIAPVTVDNGEWVWAFAYANVMNAQPESPDRDATLS